MLAVVRHSLGAIWQLHYFPGNDLAQHHLCTLHTLRLESLTVVCGTKYTSKQAPCNRLSQQAPASRNPRASGDSIGVTLTG